MSDIVNILDLFSEQYFIANINYDILKREYKNLASFIGHKPVENLRGPIRPAPLTPKPILASGPRKEKILNLLKEHGARTISEITPFFEEISEKSIQRDFADLVRVGKVIAEGEKRWRKYKLLTNV
jgi:predicted HTH transcriptional regulator